MLALSETRTYTNQLTQCAISKIFISKHAVLQSVTFVTPAGGRVAVTCLLRILSEASIRLTLFVVHKLKCRVRIYSQIVCLVLGNFDLLTAWISINHFLGIMALNGLLDLHQMFDVDTFVTSAH